MAAIAGLEQKHLPRNVKVLGWVSFFNDTATEMSYWLLPQFLMGVLGAGPMALGLIEGAAETVASLGRLISGLVANRLRRRKPLVVAGYTVANLVKPLLAVAQSWPQVFWIRFADRTAKGFRVAPRDALLADSVSEAQRGSAFGLRQAMDSAGAIVGPLSALALLPVFSGKVRSVFWMAALPGLVCVLLACFAVQELRPIGSWAPAQKPGRFGLPAGRGRQLGLILAGVGLFSLGNSSDLFLVLRAQNLGVKVSAAAGLGLVFNVVYTFLSWPAGWLSDRIPRRVVIVAGYGVYGAVYLGFALAPSGRVVWGLFAVYGMYYALTEGVLRAWMADLVPSASRASLYGILNWVVGVTAFPASLLAGWLWQHYSPAAPFFVSTVLAFAAAAVLALA